MENLKDQAKKNLTKYLKNIKLQDKFILVSGEETVVKDWCINTYGNIYQVNTEHEVKTANDYIKSKDVFKIIAGIPELPPIDLSLLKEAEYKEIGYVDVEKLAEKKFPTPVGIYKSGSGYIVERNKWKEGFKAAQQLNDKMFSLEDMKKAMFEAYKNGVRNPKEGKESFSELSNRVIQSLQQTSWDVEVEMEYFTNVKGDSISNPENLVERPKITNGKIKITKIL